LVGWYKSAENSPVVWIQHGHDSSAWTNPALQTLGDQRRQVGGLAGSPGVGEEEPHEDFQERQTAENGKQLGALR
jgi:hypothetical protein